jgi:hypothetical protein
MQVVQAVPRKDFSVILYFADGRIKRYDMTPLIGSGVFKRLAEQDFFLSRCTVMNGTLAWDVSGNYDPTTCIDLDPEVLYRDGIDVADPVVVVV